jgi:hypothetical protein
MRGVDLHAGYAIGAAGYGGLHVIGYDADADGYLDAVDNCPAVANPAQEDFDGDAIGDPCESGVMLADADLSGRVDGSDLSRLGRAFAASCGEARYDTSVDFDRSCLVSGDDLAILSAAWGQPTAATAAHSP